MGAGLHTLGLLPLLQAAANAAANSRSRWSHVGQINSPKTGCAGNRTRDLPPHRQTAYHLRNLSRI